MIPASSPIYTFETKIVEASGPRLTGAVILEKPLKSREDYTLSIVYRKYQRKVPVTGTPVNLVFLHGNGMSKGLWHHHINKIYEQNPNVNVVVAPDMVNHGESARENRAKLGWNFGWNDGVKDVALIATSYEKELFLQPGVVNIVVGHSMGGFQALALAYSQPTLFNAAILINPVAFMDQKRQELFSFGFNMWHSRGLIRSEFDIPEGKTPKEVVGDFYRKTGFFKRFKDDILANMLEDELDDLMIGKSKIVKNTHMEHEFLTYFLGPETITRVQGVYNQINIPVYHVYSLMDFNGEDARDHIRSQLQKPIPIEVEGSHSFNGENPALVIDIVQRAITEQVADFEKNGDIRYQLAPEGSSQLAEIRRHTQAGLTAKL